MPGNEPEVSTTKIAPAPAKDSVTPPTTPRKRTRRLSFADEYDSDSGTEMSDKQFDADLENAKTADEQPAPKKKTAKAKKHKKKGKKRIAKKKRKKKSKKKI